MPSCLQKGGDRFDYRGYLARIGYEGSMTPSVETLRALHLAHVLSVPFENLDVHLGQPISLDPPAWFQKIVLRRRGGCCFELNGLGEGSISCNVKLKIPGRASISFALDPCLPVDYTFANYYHSHSPDSPFAQQCIYTMPTLTGRNIFTDRRLKIRGDGLRKRFM
ncbi:MAG: nat [Nitrospira sp.]|jgi:arylamine N-acetyltransferase|nr:nat [Nitrospira sp.]